MTDLKQFIKQEAVAIIAFIAALVSCIFVPVTNYVSYIDTDLIGVMFGFMAVVAGFSVNNVFQVLSEQVAALAKDTRTGYEDGNIQAVMDGEIDGFINAYLKMMAGKKAEA